MSSEIAANQIPVLAWLCW